MGSFSLTLDLCAVVVIFPLVSYFLYQIRRIVLQTELM